MFSSRLSSLPSYYLMVIPVIAFSLAIPPTAYHMFEIYPSEATQSICLVTGESTVDKKYGIRRTTRAVTLRMIALGNYFSYHLLSYHIVWQAISIWFGSLQEK